MAVDDGKQEADKHMHLAIYKTYSCPQLVVVFLVHALPLYVGGAWIVVGCQDFSRSRDHSVDLAADVTVNRHKVRCVAFCYLLRHTGDGSKALIQTLIKETRHARPQPATTVLGRDKAGNCHKYQ
jgi:hypothetical protein